MRNIEINNSALIWCVWIIGACLIQMTNLILDYIGLDNTFIQIFMSGGALAAFNIGIAAAALIELEFYERTLALDVIRIKFFRSFQAVLVAIIAYCTYLNGSTSKAVAIFFDKKPPYTITPDEKNIWMFWTLMIFNIFLLWYIKHKLNNANQDISSATA